MAHDSIAVLVEICPKLRFYASVIVEERLAFHDFTAGRVMSKGVHCMGEDNCTYPVTRVFSTVSRNSSMIHGIMKFAYSVLLGFFLTMASTYKR